MLLHIHCKFQVICRRGRWHIRKYCVCMYIRMCLYVCYDIDVYVCMCVHVCYDIDVYVCMCVHVCDDVDVYVYVDVYAAAYTLQVSSDMQTWEVAYT